MASGRVLNSNRWFASQFSFMLLMVFSCTLALSYDYYQKIDRPHLAPRQELHAQILAGNAPSPYQYRILAPFTTEIVRQGLLKTGFDPMKAFSFAYFFYDFSAIFFSLFAVFLYLRLWFRFEHSLIGMLFIAVMMPVNFRDHYFQPWSLAEPGFFSLGLLAIYQRKHAMLGIIILLASLNRETALFIPLAYGLLLIRDGIKSKEPLLQNINPWIRGAVFGGIWLIVFLGLRVIFGSSPHVAEVSELLEKNLQPINLYRTGIALFLFSGVFWILAVLGYSKAPDFVRFSAWILPFYLLSYLVWGLWYETRVLMPLYAILAPLGLSAVFPQSAAENEA